MQALFSLEPYYEKILSQVSSLAIFKHAILWNTQSTLFYEARQARQIFEARQARHFMKHAKHVSTPSMRARNHTI